MTLGFTAASRSVGPSLLSAWAGRSAHLRKPGKAWLSGACLLLWAAALAGCGREPAKRPVDAVQQAFRDAGLTAQQAQGHRLFVQRCATCHGADGRGDGQNASNLDPQPPDLQQSLAKLPVEQRRRIVEAGSAAVGRSALCPPRGRSLAPEDVEALLAWLEAVASRPAPAETPAPAGRWRRRATSR